MKQLKFDHDFATRIKQGLKQTTLRIDDKHIQLGDRVQLVDKVSSNKPQLWEIPGEMYIVGIQEFELARMPLELLVQTEVESSTREELEAFLRRFYGDVITAETHVSLITFEYQSYGKPLVYLEQAKLDEANIPREVKLYADGGSRGNPGPSASGFVIKNEHDELLETWNKYLGITTNNQAEYHALVAGLEWCKQRNVRRVYVFLDSLLAVNQMKGVYKVKNRDLWTLYETAKKLVAGFEFVQFTHVPRELNKDADREVNKALDAIEDDEVLQ